MGRSCLMLPIESIRNEYVTYHVAYTAGISQMRDKYDRILHTFEEYVCVNFKIDSNPNADISFVFNATR